MTVDVAEPRSARPPRERDRLLGAYAGAVSRLCGYVIDLMIVSASFAVLTVVLEKVVSTVLPGELNLADSPLGAGIALSVWTFVYFAYALAASGRTIGKAIVGTLVVTADGSPITTWRAVVRALVTPFSFALIGVGLLFILVRRDRRALHDLIAGTAEVYSWRR